MDDERLAQLGQFTPSGMLTPGYGDHYLFFVGHDDVHGILHHLIPKETIALKLNMFGFDDEALNEDILDLIKKPSVRVQISLDKSQSCGVHEKKLLDADRLRDPDGFARSFCILESQTHQISHTKGAVLVGQGIGFEGSTNWSASGEGCGISLKADIKNPAGFKAQNNTLLVSTNAIFLARFGAQLDAEYQVGLTQAARAKA